jgi:hypothetical protein
MMNGQVTVDLIREIKMWARAKWSFTGLSEQETVEMEQFRDAANAVEVVYFHDQSNKQDQAVITPGNKVIMGSDNVRSLRGGSSDLIEKINRPENSDAKTLGKHVQQLLTSPDERLILNLWNSDNPQSTAHAAVVLMHDGQFYYADANGLSHDRRLIPLDFLVNENMAARGTISTFQDKLRVFKTKWHDDGIDGEQAETEDGPRLEPSRVVAQ